MRGNQGDIWNYSLRSLARNLIGREMGSSLGRDIKTFPL